MATGDVVVPLIGNLDRRQSLAQMGLYAGVEYLICDVQEGAGPEGEGPLDERIVTLKPAYPLRSHLERSDWPVSLPASDVPLWLSKATYEAGTALGTLVLAGTYLTFASILATVLRVVAVPSESMEPALMPGDVVLVTRSSIFSRPKANDVVFFDPPSELDDAIANSKVGRVAAAEKVTITSTRGKQFLKRVVGVPGDRVGVWNSNPYVAYLCNDRNSDCTYRLDNTGTYSRPDLFPDESWNRITPTINIGGGAASSASSNAYDDGDEVQTLAKGQYFVAGDNGYRSVDSRVWGPLRERYIFGTADWVIYPMEHFGPIRPGPFTTEKGLAESATQ
jgi:signal peptidase I